MITKDNIELFIKIYPEMLKKAEEMWWELRLADPDTYEYFSSVDGLVVDDTEKDSICVIGYDGRGSCSAYIHKDLFMDDNWLEKVHKLAEEREEKLRLAEQRRKEKTESDAEEKDRLEYERLKKKFG